MAVTIYIVYAGISIVENLLGSFLRQALPENTYYPGLGLLATLILIFVFGLLLNNLITARLMEKIQEKLTEIPLVKVVYSPLRDLINLFAKSKQNGLQKVVLVSFDNGKKIIGLVTREYFTDLGIKEIQDSGLVAVYIPLSYALGGYTMLVNKSQIQPLDIPVEKAMSLAVTAWIKTEPQQNQGVVK